MADNGTDWSDLFDDLGDLLSDLYPGNDPGGTLAQCLVGRIPRDDPRCQALSQYFVNGPGAPGGGNTGNVDIDDILGDIREDIGGFLDTLLDGVGGNLGEIFEGLEDALRGAIGNVGQAGARTAGDIGNIAGAILGQVGLSSRNALDIVGFSAGTAIENVGGILGEVTETVGATIDDFLRTIRDAIRNAINAMSQAITSALNQAISTITNIVNGLIDTISEAVRSAINTVTEFVNRIVTRVDELISSAISGITELADRVWTALQETIENIRLAFVDAFNRVTEFIGAQIERASELLSAATTQITELGSALLDRATEVYDAISSGLSAGIDALVTGAESALAVTRESLDNLYTALTTAVEQAGPIIQTAIAASPVGVAAAGANALREQALGFLSGYLSGPTDDLRVILRRMGLPAESADKVASVFDTIVEGNDLFRGLFVLLLIFQISSAFGQQIAQAASLKALQDMQPAFPVALPDAGAIQEMQRTGAMTDQEARDIYIRNGFAPTYADRLAPLKERFPEIGIIQVWWLRRFIDTEQAKTAFAKLGFEGANAQRLLDMAYFIPPVSDLITMSVREVFSPDIRARFQQDEGYPAQFTGFAEQQGLSEEWARNYWAAHWSLPSITMGFEMLHRRVIDESDLDLLLKAQDVMPFWREALKKISYNPLTRVDIRRMHKLGVLTNDEVRNAYKDIGYDELNAERLLQFTIELNKPSGSETPEALEDLTRSAVIDLFKRGTFTKPQAFDLLRAIGLGEDAANIYLDLAELQEEARERDVQTSTIIDQAKLGIISFSQAQDQLAALGLEPVEVQRALTDLQRARDTTTKIPSRQELDTMKKAGTIDDVVYLTTMVQNGYSLIWAERFLATVKKG